MEWFKDTVLELHPFHIKSLLGVTAAADPSATNVEASIDVWAAGAAEYASYLRELDLDPGMYDALRRLFSAASDAGHGDADWTSVASTLRPPGSPWTSLS